MGRLTDVTENFAKRLCPKPKLRGVVGSKCQKASRCSLTVITPEKAPKKEKREQAEGGHYRQLASHALCHICNPLHRVNTVRRPARPLN